MIEEKPTFNDRFYQLSEVLKKCSLDQEIGKSAIFTTFERILINQERGRILSGIFDYQQNGKLELKIKKTITIKN